MIAIAKETGENVPIRLNAFKILLNKPYGFVRNEINLCYKKI